MRNADGGGRPPGIMDVLARAAGTFAPDGLAMVIELQGDADHVETRLLQKGRRDS